MPPRPRHRFRALLPLLIAILTSPTLALAHGDATTASNSTSVVAAAAAARPPSAPIAGFNTWNAFGLAITAADVRDAATEMVSSGLRDAGYDFVIIGGGWACARDAHTARLVPCPEQFPRGLQPVVDDLHAKGLRVGLAADIHNESARQFVHFHAHYDADIRHYQDIGVDLVHVDGGAETAHATNYTLYFEIRRALGRMNSSMLLSVGACGEEIVDENRAQVYRTRATCRIGNGLLPYWDYFSKMEMLFQDRGPAPDAKNATPKQDAPGTRLWTHNSVMEILDLNANFYADRHSAHYHNDMGPLMAGLQGKQFRLPDATLVPASNLSLDQELAQLAIWAFLKSPLIFLADPRNMSPETRRILKLRAVLDVHSDSESSPARKIESKPPLYDVFAKNLTCRPAERHNRCGLHYMHEIGVLIVNRRTLPTVGYLDPVRLSFEALGLCERGCSVLVENLADSTKFRGSGTGLLTEKVPYGGVGIFRLTPTGSAQVPRAMSAIQDILGMGLYWRSDDGFRLPPNGWKDTMLGLLISATVFAMGATAFVPPRKRS